MHRWDLQTRANSRILSVIHLKGDCYPFVRDAFKIRPYKDHAIPN